MQPLDKIKFSKLDENEIQERLLFGNQLLIKDKFKVNKVDIAILLISRFLLLSFHVK